VAAFGPDTLAVLREQPNRVAGLKGITIERARQWQETLRAQQGADAIMVWLLQWDIDPSVAHRLYAQYGAAALAKVQANPYVLTQEMWGVGFHTADRMALSMGWAPLSPERLEAVWRFGLDTALGFGDCYQTTDQLVDRAVELLSDQDPDAVRQGLAAMQSRFGTLADVIHTQDRWCLRWVDRLEAQLARDLRGHPRSVAPSGPIDWTWLEARTGVTYAPAQREALTGVLQAPFSVITGDPEPGKRPC
jgi:exodeoxyribonuclease V alpha subunit